MKPSSRKPGNMKQAAGRLLVYMLRNYKWACILVMIFILASTLANITGTMFMKSLIDDYILPLTKQTKPDYAPLFNALLKMGAIYLMGICTTWLYNRIMIHVAHGTMRNIRDDLFAHMEKLPIGFFDTHAHGDIMSIYTNDADTLRQMISMSLPQMAASLITIVSVFISMLMLSIPLTILLLVLITVMIKVSKTVTGKSGNYFVKQQMDLGKLNGYVEEIMEGQKVVKVFGRETESEKSFAKLSDQLFDSANNANKYANVLMPALMNLGNINYAIITMAGSVFAITGVSGFTLGSLASFIQFVKTFNQPIGQISQQINAVISAIAGAERIFSCMDEKTETDDGYVTLVNATIDENGSIAEAEERTGTWAWKSQKEEDKTAYRQLKGDIVFEDVDFGYNEEKTILHDINLYAQPGQKIAFVGSTGAGKTTITNLINRFYDIQYGAIRYDGINIEDIKKDHLRSSLGMVLQDTHLFTGTIADNIRYGKLDASDEEVIKAAKLANADNFIRYLSKGYDTILTGDGSNLSQGQRQLLAIARAAIANPPVLILDEATSSIDTRTESIIQEGMDKLMEGRTVFVIAHRLSTIRNADAIMVLEQGRIIERGDHKTLFDKRGVYYQLCTGALELS